MFTPTLAAMPASDGNFVMRTTGPGTSLV
jgi:hypothetical protein